MSGGHKAEAHGGNDDHGHAPQATSSGGGGGNSVIAGAGKEFGNMIRSILSIFDK